MSFYSLFRHRAPSLCFLLSDLLEERRESLLVLVPDGGHQGCDDLPHVRDHGEGERDPHDGEEDAK